MRKWLRNILKTLLADVVHEEIARARHAEATHVRELTAEVDDVMEKFSRQLARQAMRRLRETRAAAEAEETPHATPEDQAFANLPPKQQLRIRAGALLRRSNGQT